MIIIVVGNVEKNISFIIIFKFKSLINKLKRYIELTLVSLRSHQIRNEHFLNCCWMEENIYININKFQRAYITLSLQIIKSYYDLPKSVWEIKSWLLMNVNFTELMPKYTCIED